MIIGHVKVENNAVITHRDSFLLDSLSVVSVRRPWLGGAWLIAIGMGGFAFSFSDLLYPNEIITLSTIAGAVVLIGLSTAQLSLLSRDLKGTELASAVWGTPSDLQRIRRKIVTARQQLASTHE